MFIRYADFSYETELENDNERIGGLIKYTIAPSPISTYSLNIDSVDVMYKNNLLNEDYKRNDAFVNFSNTGDQYELTIDGGYTEIEREISNNLNGFLGKLEFVVNTSLNSNLRFYSHSQYTDSSRNFLETRAFGEGLRRFDTAISSDIFYERYYFTGYRWSDAINTFEFQLLKFDQDYKDDSLDDLDRAVKEAGLLVSRRITRLADLFFAARIRNQYYKKTFIEYDDQDYSGGSNLRISRSLYVNLVIDRSTRKSNEIGSEYIENSVYLGLEFRSPSSRH